MLNPEDIFLDSRNKPGFDEHKLEGSFEKPLPKTLSHVSLLVIGVGFLFLGGKLYSLQISQGEYYKERAENNAVKIIPVFPLRGVIEDRNGSLLAFNRESEDSEILERKYIEEPGFSSILGYVSYPKKDQSGVFWQEEYVGKDGAEKQFQDELLGVKGERIIEISARQEIVSQNVTKKPISGRNVKLTIDGKVQKKMYESIKSLAEKASFEAASAVLMDARNGEIIGLVNYPEYDNNIMTNSKTEEERRIIAKDLVSSENKFLNRPVSGLFIPGSTVKPFVALAALEEKIISPLQNIYSSGQLVIKNRYGGPDTIFRDWKKHGYVDMREALAVSSDEYFYQIGGGFLDQKGLGINRIHSYMKKYGLESETGVNLPGEMSGVIPSIEWKKAKFKNSEWRIGDTYHTSIGQFGFLITPLELTRSYALLVNGGYLVTPTIRLGEKTASTKVPFEDENIKVIKEGMRQAVTGGTAHLLNIGGVSVGAKTGTAEVGAKKEKVNSLVVAYFPADNPKYVLTVVMEKAKAGNTFGAPIAASEIVTFLRDETDYTK
jgi:penicillin-binding protein 2